MRSITGASAAAGISGRMIPPAVVTMPLTSTRSLTATTVPWPDSSEIEMNAFSSARSPILFRASSRSITPILGSEPGAAALSLPTDVEPVRRFRRRQPFLEQGRRADLVRASYGRDPDEEPLLPDPGRNRDDLRGHRQELDAAQHLGQPRPDAGRLFRLGGVPAEQPSDPHRQQVPEQAERADLPGRFDRTGSRRRW